MDMTTTAAIAVLAGLLSTVITALAKHPSWSTERKRTLSLIVSAVLGLISAIITRAITPPAGADWPWWETAVSWLTWIVIVTAIVISLSDGIYGKLKGPLDALSEATSSEIVPAPPSYQARVDASLPDHVAPRRATDEILKSRDVI